jgi:hypothetical protein
MSAPFWPPHELFENVPMCAFVSQLAPAGLSHVHAEQMRESDAVP